MGRAFAGAETVWVLTPPGPRAPEQSSNALWAARQAGATHVVRMSAVGAAFDAPTINSRMHMLSDAELSNSGLPFTIVRPHFFMQNLMMSAQSVAKEGAMYLALGEGKLGLIDSRDISEFAAKVLTTPGHEGKTYTLTGPQSLNMTQVAALLGQALKKPVKYVAVPNEAAVSSMTQMGMDEWMVNALSDYFAAYSRNWADLVTPDFQKVVGKEPRSFSDFARDFAGAFGGGK